MNDVLHQLAQQLGIATQFSDAGINRRDYSVTDKTIRFFASALGYPANTEKQAQNSLTKLQAKRWRKMLSPIYVCEQNEVIIDVVSPDLSSIEITATDAENNKIKLAYDYMRDAQNYGIFYKSRYRFSCSFNSVTYCFCSFFCCFSSCYCR